MLKEHKNFSYLQKIFARYTEWSVRRNSKVKVAQIAQVNLQFFQLLN